MANDRRWVSRLPDLGPRHLTIQTREFIMSVLLKIVSVIAVLIAGFLTYAVIHAAASAGGARVGVAIGYIAAAIVLCVVAGTLWRKSAARS
jgi:multisubunit Na+/H+ antiporter MnhB subunit